MAPLPNRDAPFFGFDPITRQFTHTTIYTVQTSVARRFVHRVPGTHVVTRAHMLIRLGLCFHPSHPSSPPVTTHVCTTCMLRVYHVYTIYITRVCTRLSRLFTRVKGVRRVKVYVRTIPSIPLTCSPFGFDLLHHASQHLQRGFLLCFGRSRTPGTSLVHLSIRWSMRWSIGPFSAAHRQRPTAQSTCTGTLHACASLK